MSVMEEQVPAQQTASINGAACIYDEISRQLRSLCCSIALTPAQVAAVKQIGDDQKLLAAT